MPEDTSRLNTSKLGTKQYWDDFYKLENSNFQENPQDTGEEWFDDSDAAEKMCEFLMDNLSEVPSLNQESYMCDMGTGNGRLLFQLREEGFQGKMVGVDYSEHSVRFARDIAEENEVEGISFERVDILTDNEWLSEERNTYDVVLDKGTLDAIALSDDTYGERQQTGPQVYPHSIGKLLKKGGIFLITSCNFTEAELVKIIESCEDLKVWKKIEYPVFEFGGIKGSTICSIAFIKS
ncbi:hypothetical protein BABINDRAFT_158843 [Babjeviella inositovora NRRL Y-12698]|uniref:Protein-lysine N-methyltransferase EFM4 n=1 Tax=Babjeviella inositovora NRRL Y-12698 TaxID=984486 RepID=A0A1E3QYN0_9ASCO|nr:uncharacterized protein BABINDRAFT_158843 [Babjeviella inositovora NRRL Y-12698]ODQ82197.1 hypothetical protein BABINDRAFT_158843 [Babjeviella inositovora NRRL Y-12698]